MNDTSLLKLSAGDVEDLAVISACVQDALVPIGEMTYLPAEQAFQLALNRFRWDRVDPNAPEPPMIPTRGSGSPKDAVFWDPSDRGPAYERVMSGLRFEHVTSVQTRGIDLRKRERILELLTIHAEQGAIVLVFAGDATIRLEVTELRCFLEDFGQAWPTRWRPHHPEEGGTPAWQ
jgi:Protein of unknown function (DUF2948)